MPTDMVFLNLMKDTCTIVLAHRPSSVAPSAYGHRPPVVQDGGFYQADSSYSISSCYLRPYSDQERAMTGRADQQIKLFYLYIPKHLMPEGVKSYSAASKYQVTSVYRKHGSIVDTGPFDIESVEEQAGQNHHWRLSLKRVA